METIILGVIGPKELIVIVIAVIFLFGGKKIPELMKGIGEGIKEFKKAVKDDNNSEKLDQKSINKE